MLMLMLMSNNPMIIRKLPHNHIVRSCMMHTEVSIIMLMLMLMHMLMINLILGFFQLFRHFFGAALPLFFFIGGNVLPLFGD
jgi:hypothetical protein